MRFLRDLLVNALAVSSLVYPVIAAPRRRQEQFIKSDKRALQDIVTWDANSLFVNGKRILFYSGEFHPYRLPVPGLWLDVFQKIRSLGYTGVSFYVDWALLEGKPGEFRAEGVFDFDPFFEAASKAGIYLLARPGPYINAEASGGGFPGWLQRVQGLLRTAAPGYLNATNLYVQSIGEIIAKAQITNGGPVIMLQPENEYSGAVSGITFPDPAYMQYVEDQYRNAGIVVPFLSNDASPHGYNAPGQPAPVDIYGHDGYPLGFDCANPYTWPSGQLPTNWRTVHLNQSPQTPYAITEFQGGSFDPWGGLGFNQCSILLNDQFERVFYKNDFSFHVTIFNIYMTYGGTNWGNLGHPGGYTSYDYGAVITEDLQVWREKYSEAKLEANGLIAFGDAYLTATPAIEQSGWYTNNSALTVTPLKSNQTQFFVIRHTRYESLDSTSYKLTINGTSQGTITVPQLSGSLTLNGRDSKIHVTDLDLGGTNLLYSTAEIFTWQKYGSKTILVVYGGPGETHELAISTTSKPTVSGDGVTVGSMNGAAIMNWQTAAEDRVVTIDNLQIYLTVRNSAYDYWVLPIPGTDGSLYTKTESAYAVVKGGYLLRNASISGDTLNVVGDLNSTSTLQLIGAPQGVSKLSFNGQALDYSSSSTSVQYSAPTVKIPSLTSQKWYSIDSLPEIQSSYDDSAWTSAGLTQTYNDHRNLTTPTSLYSSDYGYHTGTLVYRGHFTATGNETTLSLFTQGGSAFGMSAWINSTFIGSFVGIDADTNGNSIITLPNLKAGANYVITVVIDNMGLDEDWTVGTEQMKNPRGILNYNLAGHPQSDVTWKLTGNLGGEDYVDRTRGPLNEGGMYAERQGFHLPSPPVTNSGWKESGGPTEGITSAGVTFYTTSFDLDMPSGWDIPLAIQFTNSSSSSTSTSSNSTSSASGVSAYRVQLFVNGWQFGKYVHNIGPQTKFPVPEGIWNYHGTNWLAMSLWALESGGAKVEDVELVTAVPVLTGRGDVGLVDSPGWSERKGAY